MLGKGAFGCVVTDVTKMAAVEWDEATKELKFTQVPIPPNCAFKLFPSKLHVMNYEMYGESLFSRIDPSGFFHVRAVGERRDDDYRLKEKYAVLEMASEDFRRCKITPSALRNEEEGGLTRAIDFDHLYAITWCMPYERFDGKTLSKTKLSAEDMFVFVQRILFGLCVLDGSLAHTDLHLGNVMISADRKVMKMIDFGRTLPGNEKRVEDLDDLLEGIEMKGLNEYAPTDLGLTKKQLSEVMAKSYKVAYDMKTFKRRLPSILNNFNVGGKRKEGEEDTSEPKKDRWTVECVKFAERYFFLRKVQRLITLNESIVLSPRLVYAWFLDLIYECEVLFPRSTYQFVWLKKTFPRDDLIFLKTDDTDVPDFGGFVYPKDQTKTKILNRAVLREGLFDSVETSKLLLKYILGHASIKKLSDAGAKTYEDVLKLAKRDAEALKQCLTFDQFFLDRDELIAWTNNSDIAEDDVGTFSIPKVGKRLEESKIVKVADLRISLLTDLGGFLKVERPMIDIRDSDDDDDDEDEDEEYYDEDDEDD